MKIEEEEEEDRRREKMVSDTELIDRLREFLRTSDLETTTTAIVRRKLEEDFGVDLSDRKAFIRTQVDLFLQAQQEIPVKEEPEEEEEVEQKPKFKSEPYDGSESEPEPEEEDESEEEEDDSSNVKKKNKKKKRAGSNNKNKDGKKRGGGGGFSKVSKLSPELQNIVGVPEMARTEVVKQLWIYIREKDLQDPSNRKNIRCDEALRALFNVDTIDMFQMNKDLSKHIWPLDSAATVTSTPRAKQRKKARLEDSGEPQPKEKRRGGCSGFLAPLPLSDALVKFFGTGENILPRSAVVKKIWDYIKTNKLQDPSDKKTVICDDKMKELFQVDSFVGFTVPKLLKGHFIKAEH